MWSTADDWSGGKVPGAGDQILIAAPGAETGFTYSDGLLTVLDSGKTVASLNFAGSYVQSNFAFSTNDGHTVIAFK